MKWQLDDVAIQEQSGTTKELKKSAERSSQNLGLVVMGGDSGSRGH